MWRRRSPVSGWRKQRLNAKQIGQRVVFLCSELPAVTVIQGGHAVCRGQSTKLPKSLTHGSAPVGRQTVPLGHRATNLLTLLGCELLHPFCVLEHAFALLRGQGIQLGQTVPHALLGLWRKLAEAGFGLERVLLLLRGKVTVARHPLLQVGLTLALLTVGSSKAVWSEGKSVGRRWNARTLGLVRTQSIGLSWHQQGRSHQKTHA